MVFWFKDKRKREEFIPENIHFLCEQDGVSEQLLKGDCGKFFITVPSVNKAYLSRVTYGDRNSSEVALCISTAINIEKEKQDLVKRIEGMFAKLFSKDTHLDIIFLEAEQEKELNKVCKPFYIGEQLN
jgi:hypothetical protein